MLMIRLWAAAMAACLAGAVGSGQTRDPEVVRKLSAEFGEGKAKLEAGDVKGALAAFEGILAQEPKAPGSLLLGGFAALELDDSKRAADYLNRFLELAPDDPQGILWAIQANQALNRDVKVAKLIEQLQRMRAAGVSFKGAADHEKFMRERVRQKDGSLVAINEYFDYKSQPFVYTAEEVTPDGKPRRRLMVTFDEEATKEALNRAKVKEGIEVFFLAEYVILEGKVKQINIYRQEYEKPKYAQAREWFLAAIREPPKPLFSQPATGFEAAPE